NVGHRPSLDDLGPLTVAAWIRPATLTAAGAGQRRIVAKESSLPGRWLLIHTGGVDFVKEFSITELRRSTLGGLTQNSWQHVAATWDGSASATGVHIYINGVEPPYNADQDAAGVRVPDTAAVDLLIGNTASFDKQFSGAIDDVRVYARVLSQAEIATLVQR